ncbi:MAG: hypothetical protein LIO93_11030 [Bacteroidales bacterium]|nr:hypothetical protein [Bacteroidales bacterium]
MLKRCCFIPLLVLFIACTNELDYDMPTNNANTEKANVTVGLSLDLLSDLQYDPMLKSGNSVSADEPTIKTAINRNFQCLVLKQVNNLWIVDTLFIASFQGITDRGISYSVIDQLPEHKIDLTLRPGHYRMTVVLNSSILPRNGQITPGKIVNDGSSDEWPMLFSYPGQALYKQWGDELNLSYEIFSGMEEFDVIKQTELSDAPISPVQVTIPMTRKVGKLRFAIKDEPEETERINQLLDPNDKYSLERNTAHWTRYRLKAVNGSVFPSGLNVLDEAYYNPDPAQQLTEIAGLDASIGKLVTSPVNNAEYVIATEYGSSCIGVYFFTDRNNPNPIDIEITTDFVSTGSSFGGNKFVLDNPVYSQIKHNQITGVVFGITEEIGRDQDGMNVIKLRTIDEDISQLFSPYLEWEFR